MEKSALESRNPLTYTEVHAVVIGLVVGFLAGYALELGRTDLAVGTGVLFVSVALGVRMREKLPIAQRTVRREPWYALAAFLLGSVAGTVV